MWLISAFSITLAKIGHSNTTLACPPQPAAGGDTYTLVQTNHHHQGLQSHF
jgi:hypothetical protein